MDERNLQPYVKKRVEVRWGKRRITLTLPTDVFSSFQLDTGTLLLLREITKSGRRWGRVLDLGCGYGTIGLYLRICGLAEDVEGIDRDALAVAFAELNAGENDVGKALFKPGLAYEDVRAVQYDAIVSNMPAKAGSSVHALMLYGASRQLNPQGEVWIVVVKQLEREIDELLSHPEIDVTYKVARKGHVVYNYRFRGLTDLPEHPYVRSEQEFSLGRHSYAITAFHGLQEFDELSIDTQLLLRLALGQAESRSVKHLLVCNPGQGHIPIVLSGATGGMETITVRSRDLLALRCTRHNLILNGFSGQVRPSLGIGFDLGDVDTKVDLIAARLQQKLGFEINAAMVSELLRERGDCPVIVGCTASLGARIEEKLRRSHGLRTRKVKSKGFCAIRFG